MGSLKDHNVMGYKENFDLTGFVETGTWRGDGLAYAETFGFVRLASIEVHTKFAFAAAERFSKAWADGTTKIFHGKSVDMLRRAINFVNQPGILFWLDAHLPIHYGKGYTDKIVSFPLEKEIEAIKNSRDVSRDVFIMDDLRMYEDGPFKAGPWLERTAHAIGDPRFIFALLGKTHTVIKDYRGTGSAIAVPRKGCYAKV